jgi:hypothetical protein
MKKIDRFIIEKMLIAFKVRDVKPIVCCHTGLLFNDWY